jgi:hypothetical protein
MVLERSIVWERYNVELLETNTMQSLGGLEQDHSIYSGHFYVLKNNCHVSGFWQSKEFLRTMHLVLPITNEFCQTHQCIKIGPAAIHCEKETVHWELCLSKTRGLSNLRKQVVHIFMSCTLLASVSLRSHL